MNSLEMTKLRLLSHSKNMLDAAQQSDWTRLSALENGWTGLLQSSVNQYGDALMQTGLEILKDNQKIKDMGIKARKRTEELFNIDEHIRKTQEIYESLL